MNTSHKHGRPIIRLPFIEAHADADANTTTYLSQIVGRIERPDYRETFVGRYVDLDIIGNTGSTVER